MTDPQASITRHLFTWRQIAAQVPVSRELIERVPHGVVGVTTSVSDEFSTFILDKLVAQMRAYVLTHQLAEHSAIRTRVLHWPATPWQHWKHNHAESWWLHWLVKRRPVRMQHQTVDYREVWRELASYPWQTHVPMMPGLGSPTRVVEVLSSDWSERWGGYR